MTIQVIMSIADISYDAKDDIDIIEIQRHRLDVLKKQREAHEKPGFIRSILPSLLNAVMEDLNGIMHILEDIAPVC